MPALYIRNLRKIIGRLTIMVIVFSCITAPAVSAQTNFYKDLEFPFFDPGTGCSSEGTVSTGQGLGSVYFVGDSLMVGMKSAGLESRVSAAGGSVAGVEATVGDSVDAAFPKIGRDANQIKGADDVVIELGTNPGSNTSASSASFVPKIKEVVSYIKSVNSDAKIYWMNAYADNDHSAYGGVNQAIDGQSASLGYTLIDWHGEAQKNNSKYAPFAGVPGPPLVHPSQHYDGLASFVVSSISSGSSTSQSDCSCSDSSLVGSDRETQSWNYFKGKSLSDQQAAGILGNMLVESHFDPTIMQKGGNSQNPSDADPLGYGLIQWTPGSKIITEAKEAGLSGPIYALSTQLDLVWQHMHNNPVVTQPFSLSDFTHISDEKQAAIYFRDHIEGGADPNGVRETYATDILNKYAGTGSSDTGGSSSSCSATTSSGSCKVNGIVYDAEYYQPQLAEIFGDPGTADNHPDLHLTTADFLGHSAQVSPLVAPCLEAVGKKIQSENINYTVRQFGCYRFDSNNGSSNIGLKSYHTYGAACDINWDTNPWSGDGSFKPHDMPQAYIQAFHDYGFTWGGDWHSVKDYMHFEWHGVVPQ